MLFDFIETISNLHKLKQSSVELTKIKESVSSETFATLLAEFEKEVDKLSLCLADVFDNDAEIMQLIFELKSVTIQLRAENVERLS
jgi:hypothetical protein